MSGVLKLLKYYAQIGLFVVFSNLFREGVDYPGDYVMVLMKRANKNRMTFSKGIYESV